MKFGAIVPTLNEWRFVPAVVGQLLKFVDRCAIARSSVSFSGAPAELSQIPKLDSRVEVLEGAWANAHATRNAGIEALSDCDYVFTIDSDEILLDDALAYLRNLCLDGTHKAIGTRLFTYWKTPEYRIDPPEPLVAPMVVRRDVRFTNDRRVGDGEMELARPWCHHLSYVRTDEEVKAKIALFPHAHEVLPGWYERIWKRWDSEQSLHYLHPTHPPNYHCAIHAPNAELLRVLAEFGCWP